MTTSKNRGAQQSPAYFPAIALDEKGDRPLYRQIYEWFRDAVLAGRLRPGQEIPSTRSLAAHLKVSRAPVLVAFDLLLAEGYLESKVGAGTRISTSLPQDIAEQSLARQQTPATKHTRTIGGKKIAPTWDWNDPWWSSDGAFSVGIPDTRLFPSGVWASLFVRHARGRMHGITGAMGLLRLRQAIAEYLHIARGVRCSAEQIMIVAGAQHGLQVAANALLGSGDAVWMENPGYWGASSVLKSCGATVVPVPVDREGMNIAEGLQRRPDARVAYVTPAHQFPLGCSMSVSRRLMLLDWARRSNGWILEDDYNSEFRFEGPPISSLQSLDTDNRVIYIGTFSKAIGLALRVGYMAIPMDLVDAFRATRQAFDLCSPTLIQLVLADFLQSGHFARHMRKAQRAYATRREALAAAIRQQVGNDLEIVDTGAGLHLVVLLPKGIDDIPLCRRLAAAGVSAVPLSTCYLEPPAQAGLLLGFASANVDELRKATPILAKVLRETLSTR